MSTTNTANITVITYVHKDVKGAKTKNNQAKISHHRILDNTCYVNDQYQLIHAAPPTMGDRLRTLKSAFDLAMANAYRMVSHTYDDFKNPITASDLTQITNLTSKSTKTAAPTKTAVERVSNVTIDPNTNRPVTVQIKANQNFLTAKRSKIKNVTVTFSEYKVPKVPTAANKTHNLDRLFTKPTTSFGKTLNVIKRFNNKELDGLTTAEELVLKAISGILRPDLKVGGSWIESYKIDGVKSDDQTFRTNQLLAVIYKYLFEDICKKLSIRDTNTMSKFDQYLNIVSGLGLEVNDMMKTMWKYMDAPSSSVRAVSEQATSDDSAL